MFNWWNNGKERLDGFSYVNPHAGKQKPRPYMPRQEASFDEYRGGAAFPQDKRIVSTLQKNRPTIDLVRKTFGDEGNLAMSVLLAENRTLNPNQKQIGGGPAKGLFQFEPRTWKDMGGREDQMFDPNVSTDMAKKLRDKRGWDQWTAHKNGLHKQFLPYMDLLR